jgi:hypothetical protein
VPDETYFTSFQGEIEMFKKRLFASAVLIICFGFGMTQTHATPITVGSGWFVFVFGEVGSPFSNEPFTFSLASAGSLKVTDAYLSGDQFEILDNAVSLGDTSVPTTTGDQIFADFDMAFTDLRWSSREFSLGPGSHTITGITKASPFGSGDAALRVDLKQIPEPASMLLISIGLAGLGFTRRRRRA